MTHQHSLRDLLHATTHLIPGVPAHAERTAGHQGEGRHGRGWRPSPAHPRSQNHRVNHSPARPPRVLVAWQARIARLFGQELG
jgi:hypothetical protein